MTNFDGELPTEAVLQTMKWTNMQLGHNVRLPPQLQQGLVK